MTNTMLTVKYPNAPARAGHLVWRQTVAGDMLLCDPAVRWQPNDHVALDPINPSDEDLLKASSKLSPKPFLAMLEASRSGFFNHELVDGHDQIQLMRELKAISTDSSMGKDIKTHAVEVRASFYNAGAITNRRQMSGARGETTPTPSTSRRAQQ